jgi:molecular chaperone GrpE (heat shock protein)
VAQNCVLFLQYDALIRKLQNKPNYQKKEADEIAKQSRKHLSDYIEKILYCLDSVGLLCASEVSCSFTCSDFSCMRLGLKY